MWTLMPFVSLKKFVGFVYLSFLNFLNDFCDSIAVFCAYANLSGLTYNKVTSFFVF